MRIPKVGAQVAVTGVTGFVGHHVARALKQVGARVVGLGQPAELPASLHGLVDEYISADLAASWPLADAPLDGVVHLAGLAAVGPSFTHPHDYLKTNGAIMVNLGEALAANRSHARVIVVSSGAVYGSGAGHPFTETDPVQHTSPYVVSKALVENLAAYYRARGLETVVARPFNHIGPGQGPGFLVPDLAAKLAQVHATGATTITTGNLTTRRDYTDVRDVAAAYLALLTTPTLDHTTYNIASGTATSGLEILTILARAMGITPTPTPHMTQARSLDPNTITGDATRLHTDTGWQPKTTPTRAITDYVTNTRGDR